MNLKNVIYGGERCGLGRSSLQIRRWELERKKAELLSSREMAQLRTVRQWIF